jgi:hypothetical protein
MAIRRLAEELAGLQAARLEVEARIGACQKTLEAHKQGRSQLISLAILIPMTAACCLSTFLAKYLRDLAPESAILADAPRYMLIATIGIGVITVLFILGWLNTPTVTPSRKQSELDLVTAQESLQSVNQSIRALESDLTRHRGIVSLDE